LHIIQAIILGLVQGLTEFIPVSSSAHLLFMEKLFHWNTGTLTFDVALHWGTLIALLGFFWRDWVSILASFGRHIFGRSPYPTDPESAGSGRLLVPILVASIPAAILGLKYDAKIEAMRDRPWILPAVAAALAVFACVMLLAEKVGKKQREMGSMNYGDYIIIGIAQALALFPGVSRSGITISAGLFRGMDRAAAARFSFLLSTPIIFAAGLKKIKDVMEAGLPAGEALVMLVGFATAAISGYFAIRFLMSYLQRGSLKLFAAYRFLLAAAILATLLRF
jgi:undecaprenyl-diphosphatase